MGNIRHTFVSGMRFQTEVQYRAHDRHGLVWQKIPTTPPGMAHDPACTALCITQCLALQSHIPRPKAMALFRRLRRFSELDTWDAAGVKRVISTLGLPVPLQAFPVDSPVVCGSLVQAAMATGGVCMLRCVSRQGVRWRVVVGVETTGAEAIPCALLLLDTDLDEPWACGHNIRMELQREAGKGGETEIPEALVCRSLAGAASVVRLRELLVFQKPQ